MLTRIDVKFIFDSVRLGLSSFANILHFPEVNRKTRNNISNKSWRILDMAWV